MVKLIDKAIVINVEIYKNERKLVETKESQQIYFILMEFQLKVKSQI